MKLKKLTLIFKDNLKRFLPIEIVFDDVSPKIFVNHLLT